MLDFKMDEGRFAGATKALDSPCFTLVEVEAGRILFGSSHVGC